MKNVSHKVSPKSHLQHVVVVVVIVVVVVVVILDHLH